tara:strand:- start:630 stop:851 length:222 start_codon:yes stop_codon:yes gene_type:complete
MTAINRCRLLGSILLIIGYFLVLYVDVKFGCTARLFGNLLVLPFSINCKAYDIACVSSFFAVIDITKIIQLSF